MTSCRPLTAGLPMLLAGGFWTSGTGGGAVIAPILGGLAVLSFGGLVGRLAGRRWAPAGALVLALTLPELFTSRDAFSETAVQVLLFGGLSLVIDALTVTGRDPDRGTAVAASKARRCAPGSPDEAVPLPAARRRAGCSASVADRIAERHARPLALADRPPGCVPSAAARRLAALVSGLRSVSWRDLAAATRTGLTAETLLAGVGGLALGLTSLLSLASLPYLVPAILVAGVFVAARTNGRGFVLRRHACRRAATAWPPLTCSRGRRPGRRRCRSR